MCYSFGTRGQEILGKTNAASEMRFGLISFSECFNLKKLNSGFYQRRGSRFASFFVKTGHLKKKGAKQNSSNQGAYTKNFIRGL